MQGGRSRVKLRAVLLSVMFLTLSDYAAYSSDVSVPTFDLITRGYMDNGTFKLGTYGDIGLQISGGYKFGGAVLLGFQNNDLASITSYSNTNIFFQGANVTVHGLFNLPMDLVYFTGLGDTFANGDIFPQQFGTAPIASRLRGYLYFPTGIQYDGIYTLSGTGLKITIGSNSPWYGASAYIYQDANLGAGYYSSDLRFLLNLERFKVDAFVGSSFPYSSYGLYRGGVLLYYDTGSVGSFLAQIGVPRYDPATDTFGTGLFYLLFEPRVDFGSFAIIPTLFWHPAYYNDLATNEVPALNINVNFRFGDPNKSTVTGGTEAALNYATTSSTQFSVLVSPYLSLVASGVIWDFKVNVKLYPFDLGTIAEGFVGVQAQF